jgi:uncharacterized RDD family membrane protein YckC
MTYRTPPPPPPGNVPPGGYPPRGYAYPVARLPKEAYTPWLTRVLAWIIDYLPYAVIMGIGYGMLAGTRESACVTEGSDMGACGTQSSTTGELAVILAFVVGLAYQIWNLGYRQGTTGSSIGKGLMKFRVVSEKTGGPIGFGLSVVRELIYYVASAACGIVWLVAVLFPLWDTRRQSLADKILSTVCVPVQPLPSTTTHEARAT